MSDKAESTLRTPEEAEVALRRISRGEVRRSIPARSDDDDVVIGDIIEEWLALRSIWSEAHSAAVQCATPDSGVVITPGKVWR